MSGSRSASGHGAIGGMLAATAIVLFFLVTDLATGEALDTPAFLAGVLLGQDGGAGLGLILVYTAIHYALFIGLGAAVGAGLKQLGAPATGLGGLVIGFLLFDVVFYASVAFTGVDVVEQIGWPFFLAGNLLGGLTLMIYLGRSGAVPSRSWKDALAEHRTFREGLVTGVLGALAVAGWFFVVDLILGRLLYTPGALGSALLQGATSPEAVEVTATTVLGYSAFHFTGFIAMGLVFTALVVRAAENPPLFMGLVLLFVTFETLLLGLVAILAAWLLDVLPWWSIAASNVVAASVMVAYLWRSHPKLRLAVQNAGDEALEARAGQVG